ncbi:hypothetical protein [Crateriforma spongiae]|uniref:hypothetical protein n=1 Tax=Crateriforma spongiae TaxID=2724528 RepID=UPI001445D13E|nr:hypothetical protein [Crateriforma spongiae]
MNTTPAGTHFLAYLHADQSEIMDRNTRACQQTVEMLNETRASPAQTRLVIDAAEIETQRH